MDSDHFAVRQFFTDGGAVPEVDPADLESVLQMCGGVQQASSDREKATGQDIFAPVCSSGVIKVAARFPMEKMEAGIVRSGLPFDLEEFMKQLEAEREAR